MSGRSARAAFALVVGLAMLPCGARALAVTPAFGHVFIVVEENHSYSEVVGNSSMPFLNMLINNYGLATHYYANAHPSLPNYLWLTTGSNDGITADVCPATVTQDNIVRHLNAAGISWKVYAENLPYAGFLGCAAAGGYVAKHNPFVYFRNVKRNIANQRRIVPFTRFARDRTNHTLARYSFIIPNLCNDGHDCSLSTADAWLNTNISPLLNMKMFQPGNGAVLIIMFDESVSSDTASGGGHVVWVIVGPKIKQGYISTTFYQHQNTLRLMLEGLGVMSYPQGAATAWDMREFFSR
ncbi:MAG TPA: alkaline phosphatase family protein [Candidatus Binataceae bacterium]|nr:alkaline phosphatase family protein [Candidatus Binataceae bacterium]